VEFKEAWEGIKSMAKSPEIPDSSKWSSKSPDTGPTAIRNEA